MFQQGLEGRVESSSREGSGSSRTSRTQGMGPWGATHASPKQETQGVGRVPLRPALGALLHWRDHRWLAGRAGWTVAFQRRQRPHTRQ